MQHISTVRRFATCAVMTALMCVLGPLVLPIGPVPVSFTNLILYLAVCLLGTKDASLSYLIYLLLGAVGLPVFSGYAGGLAKLAGPTGGYLFGFIFMIFICGIVMKKFHHHAIITFLGMTVATAVAYFFGTVWFVLQMQCSLQYALTVCVLPFILFDLVKILIAISLGKSIRLALTKAKLLPQNRQP